MSVYWFKYKSKPSGKILTFVSSNKQQAEEKRKRRIAEGFKCTPINKSYGTGALIWGHKMGK